MRGVAWHSAGPTCSSAFRAHVVLCTVGDEICSRKSPCRRCGPILSYFRVGREEAFRAMDKSQPKTRSSRPGDSSSEQSAAEEICCPICMKQRRRSMLGQFWKKFGYAGPPYCSHCSGQFRNHVVRVNHCRLYFGATELLLAPYLSCMPSFPARSYMGNHSV